MRKNILVLLFLTTVILSCREGGQEIPETTYYFIRHAEKDRRDPKNRDPELTEKGHDRARQWSVYFEDKELDEVYSTNYLRTTSTAVQTAISNGLVVKLYDPRDLYDSIFRANTKNKNVLVVGHSNTTPDFVNKVIGKEKYSDIADDNNANLYTVQLFNSGKVTVQLDTIGKLK